MTADPENPKYLTAYVENLIERGRLDEAEESFSLLKKHQPGAPRTIVLQARLLAARNRGAEAAALVEHLPGSDSTLDAKAAAELLEKLGQYEPAERLYRQSASDPEQPQGPARLALFLAQGSTL